MKFNVHVIGSIALFIVILFCLQDCRSKQEVDRLEDNISAIQDSVRYYKLSNGQESAEKKSLQLTVKDYEDQYLRDKKALKLLKERIGKLNNLSGRTDIGVVIHDTVKTAVHDTIYKGDTAKAFAYNDKFLRLNGLLHNDSVTIDYEMQAKLDVVYFKKKGISSVNITSDNPKLKITSINDISINKPKRFFQRNSFWFGVGILGTVLLLK